MKKIKRLSHLRREQVRLHRRQDELEKAIRSDWRVIRRTLEPATLARESLSSLTAWLGKQLWTRVQKRKEEK